MAAASGRGRLVQCVYHPDSPLAEDYRAGDMICTECGLVVGDRVIDVGSEWRTFSNDKESKDMCRVGDVENRLLSGSDLSTMIGPSGRGQDDPNGYTKYNNRRQMNSTDRALINGFKEIQSMADRINIQKCIVDKAKANFKEVYENKGVGKDGTTVQSLRGRSNDAIAAACLYIACRQESVPRTFKEICAISKVSKREIGRCFKLILKKMEKSVSVITSEDFMTRFCSSLELPKYVQVASTFIAKKAVEMDLVGGRSPISLAAAAIYMASQASKERKTAREIGEIAGVAEATIRQSYRQMYPRAKDLFPPNFNFAIPISQLPPS